MLGLPLFVNGPLLIEETAVEETEAVLLGEVTHILIDDIVGQPGGRNHQG